MERNERTTASALSVGDRFYKLSDNGKQVYQIVSPPVYVSNKTSSKVYCVNAALVDKRMAPDRLKNYAMAINGATSVVFLRKTVN